MSSSNFSDTNKNVPVKIRITNYWLITFTDLISLMVAFFVMLYAMSTPKDEMFKYQVEGMDKTSSHDEKKEQTFRKMASVYGLHRTFSSRAVSIQYFEAVILSKMETNSIFKNVRIITEDDRLIITLPLKEYFFTRGGLIGLYPEKESLFFEISEMLGNIVNKIEVAAYVTDDDGRYDVASSLSYAARVRNILKKSGHKGNIAILSGEKNKTEGKLHLNDVLKEAYASRIDIIINSEGRTID